MQAEIYAPNVHDWNPRNDQPSVSIPPYALPCEWYRNSASESPLREAEEAAAVLKLMTKPEGEAQFVGQFLVEHKRFCRGLRMFRVQLRYRTFAEAAAHGPIHYSHEQRVMDK